MAQAGLYGPLTGPTQGDVAEEHREEVRLVAADPVAKAKTSHTRLQKSSQEVPLKRSTPASAGGSPDGVAGEGTYCRRRRPTERCANLCANVAPPHRVPRKFR